MIPKKASKLYIEVAEELNISQALVEETISFYYGHVKQLLTELKEPRINMAGLGHFVVKARLVKKAIPKYTKSLSNHDTSTFAAYFNKKNLETKLGQLINIEKKIIVQEAKKETFKKLKYGNITEINLGEQTQDN